MCSGYSGAPLRPTHSGPACAHSLNRYKCWLRIAHSWVSPTDLSMACRSWFAQGEIPCPLAVLSVRMFLEDISIWIGGLRKVDCSPQCGWASSSLLSQNKTKRWRKGEFSLSPWLLIWDISLFLLLDWDLHHQFSWFSDLLGPELHHQLSWTSSLQTSLLS